MDKKMPAAPAIEKSFSPAYVYYVLFVLMMVNALAYLDRSIINILSQAIKKDLGLSDTQLGVLGGLAFVLVYTLCALPIAWIAERRSRVSIISICIAVWSLMTALCGTATSFIHLLLCRAGVGIGEAGGSPSAHSLISDFVPPRKRASAISIFVLGNPVGLFLGSVIGGFVALHFSWRAAFFVVGIPGILMSFIVKLTVKEPVRGASEEPAGALVLPARSTMQVMKHMFSRKTFVHTTIGFTIIGAVVPGIAMFLPALFIRRFGFNYAQTGIIVGLLTGLAGALGTATGGYITDWLVRHDKRWFAWFPGAGLMVCAPLFMLGFLMPDWRWCALLLAIPFFLKSMHFAPSLAAVHNMAEPRMRATAVTIVFIIANTLGSGSGPVIVGALSDFFASTHLTGNIGAVCPAHMHAAGELARRCADASSYGVKMALLVMSAGYVWGAGHYLWAARSIRNDLVS